MVSMIVDLVHVGELELVKISKAHFGSSGWDSANGKTVDKLVFQKLFCHMTYPSQLELGEGQSYARLYEGSPLRFITMLSLIFLSNLI